MKKFMNARFGALATIVVALALVACGGGGGGGDSSTPTPPPVVCTAPQVKVDNVCTAPTPAVTWWEQKQVTAVDTQSNVVKQLLATPPFTTAIGDTAWQKAVIDQTIQTGGTVVLTGFSARPATWTVYQFGVGFCTVPVYADDGGAIGAYTNPGAVCNSEAFDWWKVVGDGGIIRHFPSRSQCFKLLWNNTTLRFDDNIVACQ